jgi:hypothetical protein
MKYIYSLVFCCIFYGCHSGNKEDSSTSTPNPDWKLTSLSDSWSLYVPKDAEVILRRSDLLSEPDEIIFLYDSLRVRFSTSELGYEPVTTDFSMVARDVIKDPTLGLCQGDGSVESHFSPFLNYAMELSGYKAESLLDGERSIQVYVRQLKARKLMTLDFRFVSDVNISLVDSVIKTIQFRNR